jgi:archaellum component FlaF (FlaF/FlaG flagellin family)
LGDPGEDNTYGKGIINLEAAFNFLSLTNTPVAPNTSEYDLEITQIMLPDVMCSGTYDIEVEIHNAGSLEFGGGQIELKLDGNQSGITTWNGTLLPGESTTVMVAGIDLLVGTHEIQATLELFSNQIERELINNSRVKKFHVQSESALPFAESFESNDLSANGLFIRNPDYNRTWDTTSTAGLENSRYSARMQFLSYARKGQWDDIYLPSVDVPASADSFVVRFDYAYRFRNATLADTMEVAYSDDCGNTWNTIFRKGGQELSTIDTLWTNFKPFSASHWQNVHLNILPLISGNSVMLRFSGNNRGGSNLFLDNIGIYSETDPTGIETKTRIEVDVLPNPANEFVQIKTHNNLRIEQVCLRDMQGRLVLHTNVSNPVTSIQTSNLDTGIYFIEIQTEKGAVTKKLVVTH